MLQSLSFRDAVVSWPSGQMVEFFVLALKVNGELRVPLVGNSTSIPRTSSRMALEVFDNGTPHTCRHKRRPPEKLRALP